MPDGSHQARRQDQDADEHEPAREGREARAGVPIPQYESAHYSAEHWRARVTRAERELDEARTALELLLRAVDSHAATKPGRLCGEDCRQADQRLWTLHDAITGDEGELDPGFSGARLQRVVVAVSHQRLASAVAAELALAADCAVLEQVGSLAGLEAALGRLTPEVLVVDLALATGERARESHESLWAALPALHPPSRTVGIAPPHRPHVPILRHGHGLGLGALFAGVADLAEGRLAVAVRAVASGLRCRGPRARQVLSPSTQAERPLTRRQRETAELLAAGHRPQHIAERLDISPNTLKMRLRRLREKVGVTAAHNHRLLGEQALAYDERVRAARDTGRGQTKG